MSVETLRVWAIKHPTHGLYYGSWWARREAIHEAARSCMGVDDYDRLGNDKARWAFLKRKGIRIVRVEVKEIAK